MDALPLTTRAVAVLDRTKEPGSIGEPLYLDVVASLAETGPQPAGYWRALRTFFQGVHSGDGQGRFRRTQELRRHAIISRLAFTTTSLIPASNTMPVFPRSALTRCALIFYGLGSDGTVGANKNSIKIIGKQTGNYAQGYFVYDSKKAGSVTVSHLRFGPQPIRSSYLIDKANFIGCHQFSFLERADVLSRAAPGATALLNAPFESRRSVESPAPEIPAANHRETFACFRHRRLRGSPRYRHGPPHQHDYADLLLRHQRRPACCDAIAAIKKAIEQTYGNRGEAILKRISMLSTRLWRICLKCRSRIG